MKLFLSLLSVILAWSCNSWAITVNPASMVTADSANTALTIPYRDASGDFAAGTVTVTAITATSAITVPAGSIDTTKITGTFIGSDLAADCIDSTKIAAGSVYNADVAASAAIDTSKISGTFLAAAIAAGQINTAKLAQITSSDSGKVVCYMNDGKLGKCNTGITAVSCLCEAF